MANNICPDCGHELKERSGVSKKTGNPYSFIGCTNFPACRYIQNGKEQGTAEPQNSISNERIMTALGKIYNKLLEIEDKISKQKD